MNSGSPRSRARSGQGAQQDLRLQMDAWAELLAQCERRPGRKHVHALRVATLRLQAELEFCVRGLAEETRAATAVRRWHKQGKKLRQALGPVRQADVYQGMLARLRGRARAPRECLGAIGELERIFKKSRRAAAKKLVGEIERRRGRTERLSKKVERALTPAAFACNFSAPGVAGQMADLAGEFRELNERNLHEFRKRIKRVRYLAEAVGRADSSTARPAAALRRMTAAVGEWHDWQALAGEAACAIKDHGEGPALIRLLEARAGQSLEQALEVCRRTMAGLTRNAAKGKMAELEEPGGAGAEMPRKPVASVRPGSDGIDAERSLHAA